MIKTRNTYYVNVVTTKYVLIRMGSMEWMQYVNLIRKHIRHILVNYVHRVQNVIVINVRTKYVLVRRRMKYAIVMKTVILHCSVVRYSLNVRNRMILDKYLNLYYDRLVLMTIVVRTIVIVIRRHVSITIH